MKNCLAHPLVWREQTEVLEESRCSSFSQPARYCLPKYSPVPPHLTVTSASVPHTGLGVGDSAGGKEAQNNDLVVPSCPKFFP